MKTVAISGRAKGINALLRLARGKNLILRAEDGHEFVLAELDDFDREIRLARQNKQLMAFLERRAKQTTAVPINEVKAELL
jgi:hypothetical protein